MNSFKKIVAYNKRFGIKSGGILSVYHCTSLTLKIGNYYGDLYRLNDETYYFPNIDNGAFCLELISSVYTFREPSVRKLLRPIIDCLLNAPDPFRPNE